LSRELWRNIDPANTSGWDLIYFVANPLEIDVPFREFCALFGYASGYQLRGFTTVSSDRLEAFYDRYDDLYSILLKIRAGETVAQRPVPGDVASPLSQSGELWAEDVAQLQRSDFVSDHVKMQWKLASL